MYARVLIVTTVLVGAVVGWALFNAPEPAPNQDAPVIVAHPVGGGDVIYEGADVIYEGASYSWCQQRSGFFSPARPDIALTSTDESTTKCYVKRSP